jgi:hypothetical protein
MCWGCKGAVALPQHVREELLLQLLQWYSVKRQRQRCRILGGVHRNLAELLQGCRWYSVWRHSRLRADHSMKNYVEK